MIVLQTQAATQELLDLAAEIAAVEGLAPRAAIRRAAAAFPELAREVRRNARYAPVGRRVTRYQLTPAGWAALHTLCANQAAAEGGDEPCDDVKTAAGKDR